MCLQITKGPIKATKDITCYKHFNTITIKGKTRYVSPYKRRLWPEKGMTSKLSVSEHGDNVNIGLHAFKYKKDALRDMRDELSEIVLKMIIPKGATYYIGTFFGSKNLASNKMIFAK